MRLGLTVVCLWALSSCMTTTGAASLRREWLRFEPGRSTSSQWKEIKTDEFLLWTDLPDDQAQRAAQLLTESMKGLKALFGKAEPRSVVPLTVVAMSDGLEFERRFGRTTWGFAMGMGQTMAIFLYGPPDRWFVRRLNTVEANDSVVQHELAHVVLYRYFQKQPRWFAEGMAQYLETFRWSADDAVELGQVQLTAYERYFKVRSLAVADLPRWEGLNLPQAQTDGLYGLSWAFVTYVLNLEPQVFLQYMGALAEGDVSRAWSSTFGTRTEELDKAVFRFMKTGNYRVATLKVTDLAARPAKIVAAPLDQVQALLHTAEEEKRR